MNEESPISKAMIYVLDNGAAPSRYISFTFTFSSRLAVQPSLVFRIYQGYSGGD
jgi:hypothetical protein